VDYAQCYMGEYVESNLGSAEAAVSSAGKLTTKWGSLKLR